MGAHVHLFQCPITHEPLRPVDDERAGALRPRARPVVEKVVGAVANEPPADVAFVEGESGRWAYPVIDGILCLLPGYAISPEGAGASPGLDATKDGVRRFYDEVGWSRSAGEDEFSDARLFEDLRPVSARYRATANAHVRDVLPDSGEYLLDAASGPIQYDDYLHFSDDFAYRVCVDLSYRALCEARRRLGERGVYAVGDITNLPLRDGVVDATISLHTIYHVPADQQADAFEELARVTRPGSVVAVVYSWGNPPSVRALMVPAVLVRRARSLARRVLRRATAEPVIDLTTEGFYFEPHSREWFETRRWSFDYEMRVWRALTVPFLTAYAHDRLGGGALLRMASRVEQRWPGACGRFGGYPLIVIRPRDTRTSSGDVAHAPGEHAVPT